jgi:hypothetical protein
MTMARGGAGCGSTTVKEACPQGVAKVAQGGNGSSGSRGGGGCGGGRGAIPNYPSLP